MCHEMKHGQRSAVLALILVALAGCSGSPTTPTPAPPLATGTYTLSVQAPDAIFVNDQLVPACPGAGALGAIVAVATVAADGGVSRVRPMTAADGTFEMELVRDRGNSQSGTSIAGSIRGVVENLHALVKVLREEGFNVLEKIDDSEYGKFAWVINPEGNKVELRQPPAGQ